MEVSNSNIQFNFCLSKYTLQGINISYLGKRKIIFKSSQEGIQSFSKLFQPLEPLSKKHQPKDGLGTNGWSSNRAPVVNSLWRTANGQTHLAKRWGRDRKHEKIPPWIASQEYP